MKCNSTTKITGVPYLRAANRSVMFSVIAMLLLMGVGATRVSAWGVTWSDWFTTGVGSQPDSANWSYDTGGGGWGNNELEIYVNSQANCHVVTDSSSPDGYALQFEAQTTTGTWSGQWYSARINTYGHHYVTPGSYVEFCCKFPNSGQGYWPAAWMLGTVGGTWPACGEIDVAEEINGQGVNHQSLHMPNWNPTGTQNFSVGTYNRYGVWWPADGSLITFNFNGNNQATYSRGGGGTWEFNNNNKFFIIMNLAIGGNFPGNPNSGTKVNGNFDVEYVEQYN
jgi:hypothetical protein